MHADLREVSVSSAAMEARSLVTALYDNDNDRLQTIGPQRSRRWRSIGAAMPKSSGIIKGCALVLTGLLATTCMATAQGLNMRAAEPVPPAVHLPSVQSLPAHALVPQALSVSEWTFHKTADNRHPDGIEQQMVWLMNRARTDPPQEGKRLATLDDQNVEAARSFFDVNLDILRAEFAAIPARPPAAFDVRLYLAAKAHSDHLIANDTQDHIGQLERVEDHGFYYRSWRGNVFSYTLSGIHGHAGFNIDWGGDDGTGMQTDRGHRQAVMSMDGNYTHVGLAVVAETDAGTGVGPLVTTGNYASADTTQADHFNRFLVGTVWSDLNDNQQYDPGEGAGGISVHPFPGVYYAVTADSGGYAVPLLDSGTFAVTFSGTQLGSEMTRTVVVGDHSFLLDLLVDSQVPQAVTGSASLISSDTARLGGIVNANGQDVDYYFEFGPTTGYGDISDIRSTQADQNISITVSELSADTDYHYRLVVITGTDTVYGSDRRFRTAPADAADTQTPQNGGGGGGCFIAAAYR